MIKLLIVQNSHDETERILNLLRDYRMESLGISSAKDAVKALNRDEFGIVITDLFFRDMEGMELIDIIRRKAPHSRIIITPDSEKDYMLDNSRLKEVRAILKKPFTREELLYCLESQVYILELEAENRTLREKMTANQFAYSSTTITTDQVDTPELVGNNQRFRNCVETAEKIASHSFHAFIFGETGTGKRTFARFIHSLKNHPNIPLIRIHCRSLPEDYFHSIRLFITSGEPTRYGFDSDFLQGISEGTLFFEDFPELSRSNLKEINDLISLLYYRNKKKLTSPQLIFATEEIPSKLMETNKLISELFGNLQPVLLELPPLRARMDDFEILFSHFRNKISRKLHSSAESPSIEEFAILKSLPWKKNLQELKDFAEKWIVFGKEKTLADIQYLTNAETGMPSLDDTFFHFKNGNMQELLQAKFWLVKKALKKYEGNKTHAARHLGITYQGLLKILEKIASQ